MAARDNVSPQQFFHATDEDLALGTEIVGMGGGYQGEHAWRGERVWMADQPHLAEEWSPGGHIYKVEAPDAVKHESDDFDLTANVSASAAMRQYHAPKAKVLGRVTWNHEQRKYVDVED